MSLRAAALLLAAALPAAAKAPAKAPAKPERVTFAQICRRPDIRLRIVAPKGGKKESRDAAQPLGEGASARPQRDGSQIVDWDRSDVSQKDCRARLSRLAKAFPGRLQYVRTPSKKFRQAKERADKQVPEGLRKDPRKGGILNWFFDQSGRGRSGDEPGGVYAGGLRDAVASRPSGNWRNAPRSQLPSSYRRRTGTPPSPGGGRRNAGFFDPIERGFREVGRGLDRVGEFTQETYRAGRAWTGDRVSDLSTAVGAPWSGGLRNGVQLPTRGTGFRFVRYGQWGTARMVNGIQYIGQRLARAGAPTMQVGDMSYKNGGPIRRHKSHQNGRDVDIFFISGRGGFDTASNWLLIRSALDNPYMRVSNVFISNQKKAALLSYARRIGDPMASRAASVMSYEPGHNDHFHIRIN